MDQGTGSTNGSGQKKKGVVDFDEIRQKRMEEKRRHTERIFFRNLLGVYSVTGNSKIRPIELIDVSEEGCSFQIPFNPEHPWPTNSEELPIRLYFSADTYLEVLVKIQNSRPSIDNGTRYTRFGCSVEKGVKSYPAYQQFVRFLKLYSEHAHKDLGDVSVFYL